MKFEFRDFETNELLATMPDGNDGEARLEVERLEKECDCTVKVLKYNEC